MLFSISSAPSMESSCFGKMSIDQSIFKKTLEFGDSQLRKFPVAILVRDYVAEVTLIQGANSHLK